ncbi:hypothetical protein LZ30DRAFT_338776 [Colletotrichum cereale]|nr:hypothetical protein LZ30DRAFT_338776 [Colletotrichum cereale]
MCVSYQIPTQEKRISKRNPLSVLFCCLSQEGLLFGIPWPSGFFSFSAMQRVAGRRTDIGGISSMPTHRPHLDETHPLFLSLIIPDKITQTRWLRSAAAAHALQPSSLRLRMRRLLPRALWPAGPKYLSSRVTWSDKTSETAHLMGSLPNCLRGQQPVGLLRTRSSHITPRWSTSLPFSHASPPWTPCQVPYTTSFHHFPITSAVLFLRLPRWPQNCKSLHIGSHPN